MGAAMKAEESLESLLQRCRDGDPDGFTELYRQLSRPLYGTALRMLGRAEDAEDAMHDTFVSFHRNMPDVPAAQLPAWLHRVLVNQCIDRLRRRRRWVETEFNETTRPAPRRAPAGLRVDLEKAIARLPKRARMVFMLHDVEGYKHTEVGELLGLTVGATKSQLFRAREILRKHMDRAPRPSAGRS